MIAPVSRRTAAAALVAVWAVATGASAQGSEQGLRPAAAPSRDPLSQCMVGAVAALEDRGGEPVGEPLVAFLTEGESRSQRFELDEDGCIGLLAVGRERVRDLDVVLHTTSGIQLERDVSIDPYAYVRYCGAEGLGLVGTVRMYKGRGEVQVVRVRQAPRVLPDLGRLVGRCFAASAGVRRPSADVGPKPPGATIDEGRAVLRRRLEARGYRFASTRRGGPLRPRQVTRRSLSLPGDRCFALAAVGGPETEDLDLVLRRPDGTVIARDVSRQPSAVAKYCPPERGEYVAELRMYEGTGEWALDRFDLEEPPRAERPAGLSGPARIAFAEAHARTRARSMSVAPLVWGIAAPDRDLWVPVPLASGRCYAFAGIASQGLEEGDLDLALVDDMGNLVSWDRTAESDPLIFHCPERTAVYRVIGKTFGARGRFLLLRAEGEGS
jgi:hypothetical protein